MSPNKYISCCDKDIDIRNCSTRNTTNLPNKYAKLMHFGFWLISNANISDDMRSDLFTKLNVYANVGTQEDFYENFYANEKDVAKTMKKFINEKHREQKKADLAAKEILPKGRDQILRDAFIDNIIAKFLGGGRINNSSVPCRTLMSGHME